MQPLPPHNTHFLNQKSSYCSRNNFRNHWNVRMRPLPRHNTHVLIPKSLYCGRNANRNRCKPLGLHFRSSWCASINLINTKQYFRSNISCSFISLVYHRFVCMCKWFLHYVWQEMLPRLDYKFLTSPCGTRCPIPDIEAIVTSSSVNRSQKGLQI